MFIYISLIITIFLIFLIYYIYNNQHTVSCDEKFTIDKKYAFTKSLRHDKNLICNEDDYAEFMKCLKTKSVNTMQYYGNMKMVSISACFNDEYNYLFENIKLPSEDHLYSKLDTDMVELYAMMMCRDVPFSEYENNSFMNLVVKEQMKYNYKIFRSDNAPGFYISQFLYHPHVFMGNVLHRKYNNYVPKLDFMCETENIVSAQNGIVNEKFRFESTPRYIRTGRDLARYVYSDNPLVYAQIIESILTLNKVPRKFKSDNEVFFIDGGIIDIHSIAVDVARIAMIACWKLKYKYCLVRPEVYGFHVNNKTDIYEFSKELTESSVLEYVNKNNKNYILTQTYPEGSPCHPSYPAGHATFIGAIVTVFKAFYDEDFEIDEYIPSPCGNELIKTGNKVRVGDELDKLASNISIGRSFAGVHYRIDGEGLYLGQEVAINYLTKRCKQYDTIKNVSLNDRERNKRVIL